MHADTFDTPEAAALDGFPDAHRRVAAALVSGDDAYVLLDTGKPGYPYLYGSCVAREDGGWREGTSSNGPGWTHTGSQDDELGTLVDWDAAPEGADQVRVSFGGETRIVPVTNGVYLVAWWRVRCPELTYPRVEAFHIQGRWIPAVDGR
ncbi:MAG TPA: hypothetical protein VGB24_13940 [Longimicrobium sp.]|jgi:hypothetical protein|uniref:hypothetical protein n=1 Tax=Longimicrobium sp. TaxID=2029185 RepID=UPI002ED89D1D